MPATTVKGGKVKGEGRVISINAKYGFLAAQGINSKVFIIPSSLKLEAPFPPLTDELHVDDLVTFEAIEQAERNGARYLAIDGSVKLKQRGKDVMFEGDGKIVRLDAIRGCFGFIDSTDVGSVFFNISAVRPSTTDVTKVLKLGQKVKFRALPNLEQPNCKWRASVVCAAAKAGEFLHVRPTAQAIAATVSSTTTANNTTSNGHHNSSYHFNSSNPHQSNSNSNSMPTSVSAVNLNMNSTTTTNMNIINNHGSSSNNDVNVSSSNSISNNNATTNRQRHLHRSGSADARPKSLSFCSSSCASSENIADGSSPFNENIGNSFLGSYVNNDSMTLNNVDSTSSSLMNSVNSTTTNGFNGSSLSSSSYEYHLHHPFNNGGGNTSNNHQFTSGSGNSLCSFFDASTATTSTLKNGVASFGIVGGGETNGGSGNGTSGNSFSGVRCYPEKSNLCPTSSWPITAGQSTSGETEINPAAMWDLYLEQQQKALSQNFSLF